MKQVSKLSLLALAILLAGCNEKVSPELQEGKSTSTPDSTSTPVPPTEYYFSLVNTSDTLLNYRLHKTGIGNATSKCEVRNTTGLSTDLFSGNPAANDITCFLEAEELSLLFGGMSFEIQASKNTCDYVGFSPYGYYNKIPGDSSAEYYQATCASEETNQSHLVAGAAALGINISDVSGPINCNDWIISDEYLPPGTRERFIPASDEDLCAFNYKSGDKEQCDIGTITVNEIVVTYTPGDDTNPPTRKEEIVPRQINCGGKVVNCIAGPIKTFSNDANMWIEVQQAVVNQEVKKEFTFDGNFSRPQHSYYYANYRRNLASTQLDYESSYNLPTTYMSVWSDPIFGKTFNPRLLDYFAANKKLDGSTLVTSSMIMDEALKSNKWMAKPLAADPFLGLDSNARVNPFYTFYCFDTAYDIKARIRMMVREWDRTFTTNEKLEYLSDLFEGANSRMDNPQYVELTDDQDIFIPYNDLWDLDNLIPMERTPGSFDPSNTIWRPTPTSSYPEGWFNPDYFPSKTKETSY